MSKLMGYLDVWLTRTLFIKHRPKSVHVIAQTVNGYWKRLPPYSVDALYYSGIASPRYPLPAIRYEVVITSSMVAIFNETNRYLPVWLATVPWKFRKAWPKR